MHATIEQGLAQLPRETGERFIKLLEHGSLVVELYAPRGHDPQQPHSRDELYVVAAGSGMFVNGDQRHPFKAGDVLFVPAGVIHRFENFTDDFVVWVIFYGPDGGEPALPAIYFREVQSDADWEAVRIIRQKVFVEEQACPPEEEWDAFDETAHHILGLVNGSPAACARWRVLKTFDGNDVAKLERFAILEAYRGRGYGKELVKWTVEAAQNAGYETQKLHAQAHLQNFYVTFGFKALGKTFMEAGIPHIRMIRI